MEKIEEQKKHLRNAMVIMEKAGLSQSHKYVEVLINYSEVYMANNEFEEAAELLNRSRNILENNGEDNRLKLAEVFNLLGAVFMHMGNMKRAEEILSESLAILIGIPETYNERAAAHVSMAQVMRAQGKSEYAKKHIETALDIFEEIGVEDILYASAKSSLGELLFAEKDYNGAACAFEKAAEVILSNYGACPPYEIVIKNLEQVKNMM